MESAGALALAALLFLLGMVAWFTIAARTHFSKDSPRRPILFALEGLSLAITVGTAILVSSAPAIPPFRSLASMALGAAACMLFSRAFAATRHRNFGVVFGRTVPDAVVQSGPYRFIRHPLYTAYILNWTGCAALSGSPILWGGVGVITLLYLVAARAEERDLLRSPLGPQYADYRKRTGLLMPRLWQRADRERNQN